MPEETIPVKRGPGRPRKAAAAPKVESTPPADEWKTEPPAAAPPAELDDLDRERIGLEVSPTTTAIGFGDGRQYRCEDGKIAERVY
jgi:hypothetical protein